MGFIQGTVRRKLGMRGTVLTCFFWGKCGFVIEKKRHYKKGVLLAMS
jgi:hypothetical protein